jgi:hypothetical protein
MHVKNHAKGIIMKALFIASLAAAGIAAVPAANAADIEVMTQNQYLGADIAPLVEPGLTPPEFFERLAAALQQVGENRPQERIAALASEIAARRPHLVGLQEAFAFECTPLTPINGCLAPVVSAATNDQLEGTLEALGGEYHAVAMVKNLDVDLPLFLAPDVAVSIRVVDRDVILARKDVVTAPLPLPCPRPSVDGCNYQAVAPVPSLGINVERGYVAVQATVDGKPYFFVNTHLETREPVSFFQAAQAVELVEVIEALKLAGPTVLVVGDFNSAANDPLYVPNGPDAPPPPPSLDDGSGNWIPVPNPYVQLTAALMRDVWLDRPGNVAGLSCCQAADLSNHVSQLYERIDLIWSSELPRKVKQARVEGDTVNTKTRPPGRGLWPSDHGAVAATLQFR